MKIRSITYFCDPGYPLRADVIKRAGQFLAQARVAYEGAGFEVQSTRLATIPFPNLVGARRLDQLSAYAFILEQEMRAHGIAYASLGPALPNAPRSYERIPDAIATTKSIFFGGVFADVRAGLDPAAALKCAQVITRSADIERNGFANLRFAALANVPAGSPFFPAAYHAGSAPSFAIASEAADLAVQAFAGARTIEAGRRKLVATIEKHTASIGKVARKLGPRFGGIDLSLAPHPDASASIGAAIENMGVSRVGEHGSLAAAAVLTEAIERARFPRAGFSGLMLPILEDSVLASRAAEGTLSVKDCLLYSAVCGTGLDTVPLPGATSAEQIVPLLLDLGALALRLDKPLTARLMPIPGKQAGDETDFDFDFFANGRVMRLDSAPLGGALAAQKPFTLHRRIRA